MVTLFEKGMIKNLELKNRAVMAPMCMYQAEDDGLATPWHLVHYATRASGGVGLVIVEATAVESRGRISDRDLGIWDDQHIASLKHIVDEVHKHGAKIGIQLAHAGRKCTVERESLVAPSALRFNERYQDPKEMTQEDIKIVIDAFKQAARRAYAAGFDLIEIHGAHGYLINQFISPLSNKRSDTYGGSLEGRTRFLEEVIEAVEETWPVDKPIIVRLSADEYEKDGHHIDETIKVVDQIKDRVDAINVSSGGVVPTPVKAYPGYQVPLAEAIKHQCGIKTIAGGLITQGEMMEEILQNNRADFVFLGRVLLREPYMLHHVAKARGLEDLIPQPYKRGF